MHNQYTTPEPETQDQDLLIDISASGKERPWAARKTESELLQMAYLYAAESWEPRQIAARHKAGKRGALPSSRPVTVQGPDGERIRTETPKGDARDPRADWLHKAARLDGCATWATFEQRADGTRVLHSSNFCRCRLCPMCGWRRAVKLGYQLRTVVAEANRQHVEKFSSSWGWVLLTLTVRNVPGDQLGDTIDKLHAGLINMTKWAVWKKAPVRGWIRTTEVTHNTDPKSPNYDTYHPHMHVLLMVPKSYFKAPIKKREWTSLWAYAAGLDYEPIVDIRRVKAESEADMASALAEVCKYAAKPADYLVPEDMDLTAQTVAVLDKQLHHRRMTAFGGDLFRLAKELHLDSVEDGDLIHIDQDAAAAAPTSIYDTYRWSSGRREYRRKHRQEDKPSEQLRQDARADHAALAPALAAHRAEAAREDQAIVADVLDAMPRSVSAAARVEMARRTLQYWGTIDQVRGLGFMPRPVSVEDSETIEALWGDNGGVEKCESGQDSPETLPPTLPDE